MSDFDPTKLRIKLDTRTSGFSGTRIDVKLYYDDELVSSDYIAVQEGETPA